MHRGTEGTACQPAARHAGRVLGVPAPARTACQLPGASQHQPKPLSAAERERKEPVGREKRAGWSLVLEQGPSINQGGDGSGAGGASGCPRGDMGRCQQLSGWCGGFGVLSSSACFPTHLSIPARSVPVGSAWPGVAWWPLPGGPLQSLQKGSRHLASPEDTGGRERRALGGV